MYSVVSESDLQSLLAKISRIERRLVKLDAERATVTQRLSQLKSELAELQASPLPKTTQAPRSAKEKVALFRSLFVGRTDVFPKFWHNRMTGRKGYAPACNNEWVRGICNKPRIKCGECPNQAFIPVSDRVILDHLQGRHVAGVYPLLEDETCRFLAMDFDKGDWKQDVSAVAATCRRLGVPVAIERSRSGDGAHVWFFFTANVPAVAARKMGCYLITETMTERHELPMSSYDRLFPNQDTMPAGGFGNLIALPLQYHARQDGNTIFVNEDFVTYPDQWAFLAGIERIDPARVEEIAREASESGQIVGVRMAEDEDTEAPWLRLPSRRRPLEDLDDPIPPKVRAVLAQQIFVEKHRLPSVLINRIKRLAAFQNPEFYKKQAMRLSTALTPRVISCAEDLPRYVSLPRGCLADLHDLLKQHGIALVIRDERSNGESLNVEFHGELTGLQKRAVRAMTEHDDGVFVAPPATGKTVVGTHLIARRGRNALILVHRTQLLDQWRAQLSVFLGVKSRDIGQIGGGKRKANGCLDVAMIQSLVRRDKVDDVVAGYGHVIVDECHHVPAVSFERIMREVKARYVTGLTATPHRRDGHHPILRFQLGPVRFAVDPKSQAARRPFRHRLVIRDTEFSLATPEVPGIQELYGRLADDAARNDLILNDVIQSLEDGRSPVLLTERREHLDFFAENLHGFARHLLVLRGGMGVRQRRELAERLASIPDDEERLLIATGRFLGEGFDDARLDALFLALPVSWKGTLVQYAGRLHRRHREKSEVRIYDYVDREVPMLARMFEKRLKGYQSMGYQA